MLPRMARQVALMGSVGYRPGRRLPAIPMATLGHYDESLRLQLREGAPDSALAQTEQPGRFVPAQRYLAVVPAIEAAA